MNQIYLGNCAILYVPVYKMRERERERKSVLTFLFPPFPLSPVLPKLSVLLTEGLRWCSSLRVEANPSGKLPACGENLEDSEGAWLEVVWLWGAWVVGILMSSMRWSMSRGEEWGGAVEVAAVPSLFSWDLEWRNGVWLYDICVQIDIYCLRWCVLNLRSDQVRISN